MYKQIAIPAPTLEAMMGSRDAAHDLLKSKGFHEIVDVYPFFIEVMEKTWAQAIRDGFPRISPACPRARKLCTDRGLSSLIPGILSPAARALQKTAESCKNEIVSLCFISPCPFKSAELELLSLPEHITFSSLPLKDLLQDVSLYREARSYMEKTIFFPNKNARCIKTRGASEAENFLSGGYMEMGPLCVDMQLCEGGCLGGAWCPE